ncbi:MAG: hypothetical protein JST38_11180 [Bacteroidetes bacterium]|nr:hypothetical protein [Bacteroidota bacterium]
MLKLSFCKPPRLVRGAVTYGPCGAIEHIKCRSPWCGALLLLGAVLPGLAAAQTEDPSDVSAALPVTMVASLAPAFATTSCSTVPFSMASVSTTTPQSANIPFPPCGNLFPPPPAVTPVAKDMWFRVDPPAGVPTAYRFSMYSGVFPSMSLGAMALYEGPNAAGPMRLIECAYGGSYTAGLPSLETSTGYTAGNKLYLRVWDRANPATSTANFQLCVQGQTIATMPPRGAAETVCTAAVINIESGLNSINATQIDYAFAKEEGLQLPSTEQYVGGDLWLKVLVPPTGNIQVKVGTATNNDDKISNIAVTAYLTDDCTNPLRFRQVGGMAGAPVSWGPAVNAQINISCLPPGEYLYLRIHSQKDFQNSNKRYGQFRIKVITTSLSYTPPANIAPCGALPLSFGIGYPGGVYTAGDNISATCSAPGIPDPGCGFAANASKSVWYKFTAPLSGTVRLDVTPEGAIPLDPGVALYTNAATSCDTLNLGLLECDILHGPGKGARIIRTGLRPGFTYYVRVWGQSTSGTFRIYLEDVQPVPGFCYYLMKLDRVSADNTICPPVGGSVHNCAPISEPGTVSWKTRINAGPYVTHSTTGNELNELQLLSVPSGSTLRFSYPNPDGIPTGVRQYALYRLGVAIPLFERSYGYGVAGPHTTDSAYTETNTCQPIIKPINDCLGLQPICIGSTQSAFASIPANFNPLLQGYLNDVAGANKGCLSNEGTGIAWVEFKPQSNGKVAFWLDGGSSYASTTDLDFAIWDVGPPVYSDVAPHDTVNADFICPPPHPPIRCSSARGFNSTGLMPGMEATSEGPGGWGWLKPLDVVAGHIYLMAVVRYAGPAVGFSLKWTLYENALGVPDQDLMGVCPYSMPLPVELLFLRAEPAGRQVNLDWATATERNSSHFTVERSGNGTDFNPIGQVAASGNTQYRTDYSYTDTDPLNGVNYYRLQQVDIDGTAEHSNVVTAFIKAEPGQLSVYPNPVEGQLRVAFDLAGRDRVTVQVLDVLGRVVEELHLGIGADQRGIDLDTQLLGPAVYVVRVLGTAGEELGSARFVKK